MITFHFNHRLDFSSLFEGFTLAELKSHIFYFLARFDIHSADAYVSVSEKCPFVTFEVYSKTPLDPRCLTTLLDIPFRFFVVTSIKLFSLTHFIVHVKVSKNS